MRWVTRKDRARELRSADTGDIIEPSVHRGWWWWATWGRDGGDEGNLMHGPLERVKQHVVSLF